MTSGDEPPGEAGPASAPADMPDQAAAPDQSPAPPVATIRPANADDVAAIRSILVAHDNDGPVIIADVVGPYIAHLIARGRTRVAILGDEVVAFGAAIDTGRSVHLADLFVHPDRLGQGIGKPLLAAVLDGAVQRTTFASDDPRALPLYVRSGMQPMWVSLYIQGASSALPPVSASLRTESASSDRLAALERDWTGHDRTLDHRFWGSMPDVDAFVVRDGDTLVAFGYARARQAVPIRVLDRLVIHPDGEPVGTTLAALARAGRGGPVHCCLLGPHPVVRPLLEAGFRVVDRDVFLASGSAIVDPARLVPNPGML
jgi:GNAT superfamily N-acetyltransferase